MWEPPHAHSGPPSAHSADRLRLAARPQSTSAVAAGFFGQTAWQGRGSLYWHLNHTRTPFGARLLYRWLCGPLRRPDEILARQEAVAEVGRPQVARWPWTKDIEF